MNNNELNNEQDSLWKDSLWTGDVPPHQVPNHEFKSNVLTGLLWELQKLTEDSQDSQNTEVVGQGLTAEEIRRLRRSNDMPFFS